MLFFEYCAGWPGCNVARVNCLFVTDKRCVFSLSTGKELHIIGLTLRRTKHFAFKQTLLRGLALMRVLVILAHPDEKSFNHAIARCRNKEGSVGRRLNARSAIATRKAAAMADTIYRMA